MKGGVGRNLIVYLLSATHCAAHVQRLYILTFMESLWRIYDHTLMKNNIKCLANGHVLETHAWHQKSSSSFMIQTPSGLMGFSKRTDLKKHLPNCSPPITLALSLGSVPYQCDQPVCKHHFDFFSCTYFCPADNTGNNIIGSSLFSYEW